MDSTAEPSAGGHLRRSSKESSAQGDARLYGAGGRKKSPLVVVSICSSPFPSLTHCPWAVKSPGEVGLISDAMVLRNGMGVEGEDSACFLTDIGTLTVTSRTRDASSLGSSCGAKKPCHWAYHQLGGGEGGGGRGGRGQRHGGGGDL